MAAALEWLGLVLVVAFVDKVDVGEGAMAVHCSQSLVEVEGIAGVASRSSQGSIPWAYGAVCCCFCNKADGVLKQFHSASRPLSQGI